MSLSGSSSTVVWLFDGPNTAYIKHTYSLPKPIQKQSKPHWDVYEVINVS
jgi:hypothetical protein